MLEKAPHILGEALKGVRPGLGKLVYADDAFAGAPETITVESPAFTAGGAIPARYTADGAKASPPLRWQGAPAGAAGVVLIVEDADSPTPVPILHCLAWELTATGGDLPDGALKSEGGPGDGLPVGKNSFGKTGWLPPDPPPGHGPHRYVFQLYAVDQPPALKVGAGKAEVVEALKGRVLARGRLMGTYERP